MERQWVSARSLSKLLFLRLKYIQSFLHTTFPMGTRTTRMVRKIALFASGTGSNVRNLYSHFRDREDIEVAVVVCNKPDAPVVAFAREQGIPLILIDRPGLYGSDRLGKELLEIGIDLIVLAGFLWLIPDHLIQVFPSRIINLHPSLLPLYGGKGMYGNKVHEAVIASGDQESGITIHLVNGQYDEGDVLFQATCPVLPEDTPDSLAQRIHLLEYEHLPAQIEHIVSHLP